MIGNYFKIAWRSLWKNKTTSFINIAGLTVGMTAATLIMMWVQNEKHFDSYHKDAEKIYRITTHLQEAGWAWESSPLLLAEAAKKEIPEIEKATRLYVNNMPVIHVNGNQFYEKKCAYVDDEWFNVFKYRFIEGNSTLFNQHPHSIILTASGAKKYFGNNRATGSTIQIDSVSYQIVGIVADAPTNSSFQFDAFMPIEALLENPEKRKNDEEWGNANYITFVKLFSEDGASATAQKLTNIAESKHQDGLKFSLTPLSAMHFETGLQNSSFIQGNEQAVNIFSIVAFLLLLIACINYVNLVTAKSSLRAKEVGVRKIIGAKRSHLFYQFITEYLVVGGLSLVLTLVLIQLCLPVFNEITDKQFIFSLDSVNVWVIIGSTLLATFFLNSIYPALLLSSMQPMNVFRGKSLLKIKDSNIRRGLVVIQFTVSVGLIACTFVIFRQMQFIQQSNPGYNRSQVLSLSIPPTVGSNKANIIESLKQDLLAQSSIESVTATNQQIVHIGSFCSNCADWDGRDSKFEPKLAQLSTDADFFSTMQLEMKHGRGFQKENSMDKHNCILNETAIRELNNQQPIIGQRFIFHGDTGQIIGIVKDFNFKSLHEKQGPLVVFNNSKWYNFMMVRIASKSIPAGLASIGSVWKKHLPNTPIEYTFLDDSFNELYKDDQQSSFIILFFSILATILSAMGLFGLAAFTVEQRTKEIGIRKVLGASIPNIIALISKEFLIMVGCSILIATPLAWLGMNHWLETFAYRAPIVWWMFAVVGILALGITLATVSYQAVKAAVANPVKSLRRE